MKTLSKPDRLKNPLVLSLSTRLRGREAQNLLDVLDSIEGLTVAEFLRSAVLLELERRTFQLVGPDLDQFASDSDIQEAINQKLLQLESDQRQTAQIVKSIAIILGVEKSW